MGSAAEWAGWSQLVLAVALALLPWAVAGRRPGVVVALLIVASVPAQVAVGFVTLRSGQAGAVVPPVAPDLTLALWLFGGPALLVALTRKARSLVMAAVLQLLVATPLVAAFSYAIGPYDAHPWWESISAVFLMSSGLLLVASELLGRLPKRGGLDRGNDAVATPARGAA